MNSITIAKYIEEFIKDSSMYYLAHLPKENSNREPETLSEHLQLVTDYYIKFINGHRLEKVIHQLIDNSIPFGFKNKHLLSKMVHTLFWKVIVFHDYGKVNHLFQEKKMKNINMNLLKVDHPFDSQHSIIGMYVFLADYYSSTLSIDITDEERVFIDNIALYLSYNIIKHHNSKLKEAQDDTLWNNEQLFTLSSYLTLFKISITNSEIRDFHNFILKCSIFNDGLFGQFKHVYKKEDSFSLYALCRLNFSLLTASDYLATNEYMNQSPLNDFGILTVDRINKIYTDVTKSEWINEAEGKKNYNKAVFESIDNYQLIYPTKASGENLNILRTEMAIEVIRNVRKLKDQNLFYIEAPTGGGKTNLSALAALELLKIHQGKYNKVFYVFPFTTLITQTYKSLKETLFLNDNEMVEIHSSAGIKTNERKEDDKYGDEKLNYINHLFVNYPFAFLSHIRFFDILKTNEKETNYLLHRLANSIVIIDELQSYNPQHWDKVIYFIQQYAKNFNIKFILMSATLPKLDKLNVLKDKVQNFNYLLEDKIAIKDKIQKKYFTNPNFSGRVSFNFDLFDRTNLTLNEIAEKLLIESTKYSEKDYGKAKPKGSVYTIIEFIFKKTATEFYELIKATDFFDEILLLSGTILPHRRKEIINYLKNKENREKKVLLVTTQVVEAGVDIDMDLGFKDRSLIDSDEQLAGRINRNVNKKDCTLFLFNYNKESVIYGKDDRLTFTKDTSIISNEIYKNILETKDFDTLYDLVLNNRNEWNSKQMVQNFTDYELCIKQLKYESVHKNFKLIEQKNISCFIPITIPLTIDDVIEGYTDSVFSISEITFLQHYGIFPNEKDEIEGYEVFNLYLSLIHNNKDRKKADFVKSLTDDKTLQGIVSKYVFSLFATEAVERKINEYIGDPERSQYGYKYITEWKALYAIDTGLRDKDFNSNETQFL